SPEKNMRGWPGLDQREAPVARLRCAKCFKRRIPTLPSFGRFRGSDSHGRSCNRLLKLRHSVHRESFVFVECDLEYSTVSRFIRDSVQAGHLANKSVSALHHFTIGTEACKA